MEAVAPVVEFDPSQVEDEDYSQLPDLCDNPVVGAEQGAEQEQDKVGILFQLQSVHSCFRRLKRLGLGRRQR